MDKKVILLCDDDKTDRILFKKYLHKNQLLDYGIIEVSNSAELFDLLDNQQTNIYILFLDYFLGDKSGLEILQEIVEKNIAPVIMITGSGDEEIAVECMKEGASDYLPKDTLANQNLGKIIFQAREKWEIKRERDHLLGLAAHELRSPISVILGYAEILKTYDDIGEDEKNQMLDAIRERSNHLLTIINGLLDVTRIDSGIVTLKKAKCNIVNLTRKISSEYRLTSKKKGIEIIFASNIGVPVIEIDPDRIQEVISNILDNAIKYSERNTKINVIVSGNHNHVQVDVIDKGQGIKESELKFLFELFSSKKISSLPTGQEPSTGIGLAICKKVIDAHGGHILVESKPGIGSKFSIILPRKH